MTQPNELVSIIISFYNKIDLLKYILAALDRQTYTNFEVVIADDGSKPEVVDEINRLKDTFSFPIHHVWHEDKGWQKNIILNKAIVKSQAEYLIFIDGDCIPHRLFVQEHLEQRAANRVISGRRVMLTENISKSLSIMRIQNGYLEKSVILPLLIETLFCAKPTAFENAIRIRSSFIRQLFVKEKTRGFWGCNFSLWRADILAVNGFDERFVYPGTGEDADLEDRLKRIGVMPVSKKHLVTVYHVFHVPFDTKYEPNIRLRAENNRNNVTFTPYGIVKSC